MNKKLLATSGITMDISSNGQHLDLFLIGYIGDWGNNIEDFLYRIRQLPNLTTIDVYINSLGGSFFDGLPIFNLLKMHTATVTTKIIGYACSMASVIMLAGDEVQATQNAIIMIHRAQGFCMGDADDMQKMADILIVHENAVIPEYAKRMGITDADVLALLEAETWFTSQDAMNAKLIDTIIDTIDLESLPPNTALPLPNPDEDDDEIITENEARYALEHYKNIPSNVKHHLQLATSAKQKPTFFQKLFKGNKVKPKPSNQSKPILDDIDMTKDELQAELTANNEKLLAKLAKKQEDSVILTAEPLKPDALESLKTELAELKTSLESLKTENASLSKQVETLNKTVSVAMKDTDAMDLDVSAGGITSDNEKW
jgi:ATP-dependent protease ClpP protease subunit